MAEAITERDIARDDWTDAQESERDWWGSCGNTFGEELKQLVYAPRMGLKPQNLGGHWPVYDLNGMGGVIDIGGGPASMLLKAINVGHRVVIDPADYPVWVRRRYETDGILWTRAAAEDIEPGHEPQRDEVWIYNTLQHTINPERVLFVASQLGRVIRLFEWINVPAHQGHPHELKRAQLESYLGAPGTIEAIDQDGATGTAFFGVFDSSLVQARR